MRFMLMMHVPRGRATTRSTTGRRRTSRPTSPSCTRFNQELTEAGELVGAEGLAAPDQAKVVRAGEGRRARRDRRPVPRGEGVPRRLLDRRRRTTGARVRDRREGVGGARAGRQADEHADRSAAGDERAARRRVSDARPRPVAHLLRELAPQVLGAVARRHGDFAAAEDAVQEALHRGGDAVAARGHSRQPARLALSRRLAAPDRSAAQRAARRRREDAVAATQAERAVALRPTRRSARSEDDTLMLLFMCCHPALTPPSAIALTLRAVGGLTTAEIASAFLVPEATMAQRISRAKQSIKASGVPFRMPTDGERASG